jgi:hypothetical protein
MADTTTESQTPATATSTTASPADASQSQSATPVAQTTEASTTPAADKSATEATPKTGDDATKPGDKPADAATKPADVNYEFTVPEGVKLDGEALNELKTTAKEFGLTQEQAQKIANLGAKQAQGFVAQLADAQKAQVAEWSNATTADKEIGGDKLNENLAVAKKALDTFGSPELKTLLNQSGLGNHPEIIRAFYKAGMAISEDGKVVTGSAAQVNREAQPIANRLYPDQK